MMLKCRSIQVFILLAAVAVISVDAAITLCGTNEEYQTCGTACPGTCDNMNDKNRICIDLCVEGCFCKAGYVRNNQTLLCVLPSECPTKCGANEVFNTCGTACPKTCKNKDKVIACTKNCVRGCFCAEGYVRDKNNKCIKEIQCPKTCGANEEYSECGANGCQNTCQNPTFSHVCKGPCIAGCICKEGYLKNSNGKCVLPGQCDSCKKPFEIFSKCDNHGCQNTCEEPNLITRCRFLPGCYPGCICQKGYLRNKAGDCVPENKCHPKTTTRKPTTKKPKV